jgi:hypothetical protein
MYPREPRNRKDDGDVFAEPSTPREPGKGRRSELARDEILSISDAADEEGPVPEDHSAAFAHNSIAHLTSEPVKAIKRPRRGSGLSGARGRKYNGGALLRNLLMGIDGKKADAAARERLVNEPKNSKLLNLPRVVREIIYEYLLIHAKPVLLHCDWHAVQNNSPLDHAILHVCWQITLEASCFVYQHNTFHALVCRQSKLEVRSVHRHEVRSVLPQGATVSG